MNHLIRSFNKKPIKKWLKIALYGVFLSYLITNTAFADTQEIRTTMSELSQLYGLGNRIYLKQGTFPIELTYGEPFYLKLQTTWALDRDLIVSVSSPENENAWRSLYDGSDAIYTWTSDVDTGELYIEVLSSWWREGYTNDGIIKNFRLDFRGVKNQGAFGSINNTYEGGKAEWMDNFGYVLADDINISDLYFYVGQNPLDFPEFPEGEEIILPDIECDTGDFLADAICKVNVLLFTPSGEILSLYSNLLEPIKNKVPFGYFTFLKSEFEGMEEGSPAFDLGVNDIDFFNPIRGFLVFIIWLFTGSVILKRIIHLEL
jgi:hypothetical protein